jgi:hypothetical protein
MPLDQIKFDPKFCDVVRLRLSYGKHEIAFIYYSFRKHHRKHISSPLNMIGVNRIPFGERLGKTRRKFPISSNHLR